MSINNLYEDLFKQVDSLYTVTAAINPKDYSQLDANDLLQLLMLLNATLPSWLMFIREAQKLVALRKAESDALDYLGY